MNTLLSQKIMTQQFEYFRRNYRRKVKLMKSTPLYVMDTNLRYVPT